MTSAPAAQTPPFALTIAGNEATGGAGAQADLKTFQELGVFGSLALTCIVSFDPSNDWGHRFSPVDPQVIADQLDAASSAYDLSAVKIGMLGSPQTIDVVAQALESLKTPHLVLDPVLICKGQEPGAALDTDNALKEKILPLATFVTPNHFETMSLSGMDTIETVEQLTEAAQRILAAVPDMNERYAQRLAYRVNRRMDHYTRCVDLPVESVYEEGLRILGLHADPTARDAARNIEAVAA